MSELGLSVLMNEAICRLCLDDGFTFVTREGEVRTADPKASPKLDEIRLKVKALPEMIDKSVRVVVTSLNEVELAMELMNGALEVDLTDATASAIGSRLVALCQGAINLNASDIHVEVDGESTRFLVRVDGKRRLLERFADGQSAMRQPRSAGVELMIYAFSTMGSQDVKLRDPANDRFSLSLEWHGQSRSFEWRSALIPTSHGAKMTLRCLTARDKPLRLSDMDLPKPYVKVLAETIHKRGGAIVVSGPMGSGKSTLVTALLEQIDRTARSVHTLEDPVEFRQEMVCKTPVEPGKEIRTGAGKYRDYAFYAVEMLRHDVDVSVLGEVREHHAAKEFCRKAETGGLAITSLHTNSAIGVPQTFIQQLGVSASIIGAPGLLQLIVHQRLVRALCPHCALSQEQARAVYEEHHQKNVYDRKVWQLRALLTPEQQASAKLKHPLGCNTCGGEGERGRRVVMELIALEDEDREFIVNEDDHGWKRHLSEHGWPDIRAHTLSRIARGQVDICSAAEQVDGLMPISAKDTYRKMQEAL